MSMIRTKHRKGMRHTTRRTKRRAVRPAKVIAVVGAGEKKPEPGLIPERLPAEEVKEVRMRLDTNDRRLLVAGLLQLLPVRLRKNRQAWRELAWEQRGQWQPVRELLERLRDARRGHPSTWGF